MNEHKNVRYSNRNLSAEEKRNYCVAWKKSGMNQFDFCKANGISKSALYQWSKQFEKEASQSDFSPLVMPVKASATNMKQITITSGSDDAVQLKISIPEDRLISFIKEMCNATSAIR